MMRRGFLAMTIGLAAISIASCVPIVSGLKLIHNLVRAFSNVFGRPVPGVPPLLQGRIVEYLRQAEALLQRVVDTVSDDSRTAAQNILAIMMNVLGELASVVAANPTVSAIVAAARTVIPIIAGLFGVAVPPTPVGVARAVLPVMTEDEAEATLEKYAGVP